MHAHAGNSDPFDTPQPVFIISLPYGSNGSEFTTIFWSAYSFTTTSFTTILQGGVKERRWGEERDGESRGREEGPVEGAGVARAEKK